MTARRGRVGEDGAASGLESALARALASAVDVDPSVVRVRVEGVDTDAVPDRLELTVVVERGSTAADTVAASGEPRRSSGGRGGRDAAREGSAVLASSDDASSDDDGGASADGPTAEELDEEADAAADLLEGLLDALDLGGDIRIRVHDAHAEVEIVDVDEGVLIGRRGQTLDAVQDLVQTAMQRRFQRRSRVMVDVDGYRARRIERLLERADEAIERVRATGEPERLEPMDVFERRIVHQRVADAGDLVSNSFGREPGRRIVIEPA